MAGMLTGADSINDLGVLPEGAVHKVLPGVKAPSTLGTFLLAFTFGHVRQLGAVAAGFLTVLAALVPLLTGHNDHRGKLAKARSTTIRDALINIPARVAFSAQAYTLRLPANSHREAPFMTMFDAVQAPPPSG